MKDNTDKYNTDKNFGKDFDKDFDKAFIEAMTDAIADDSSGTLPEIPALYSERIDAAIEHEFAAVRKPAALWRRRLITACSVAAAAAAAWFAVSAILLRPATYGEPIMAEAPADSVPVTPLQNMVSSVNIAAVTNVAPEKTNHAAKKTVGISRRTAATPPKPTLADDEADYNDVEPDSGSDFYLSEEEELKLARASYRVVSSPEEADAIICSVIGNFESNVAQEQYRMSEIMDGYESETDKIL